MAIPAKATTTSLPHKQKFEETFQGRVLASGGR